MTGINILDISSAIIVSLGLLLVPKHYKYWLLYILGCFTYMILFLNAHLYGTVILEIVLGTIAIKNFVKGYKRSKYAKIS